MSNADGASGNGTGGEGGDAGAGNGNGNTGTQGGQGGNAGDAGTQGQQGQNGTGGQGGEKTTYTKEEMEAIVADRIGREIKNRPSKEEWAEFQEFKSKGKTAEQLAAEKTSKIESELAALKQQNISNEQEKILLRLGAKNDDETLDDLRTLVGKRVGDSGDFYTEAKDYLTKHPEFKIKAEPDEGGEGANGGSAGSAGKKGGSGTRHGSQPGADNVGDMIRDAMNPNRTKPDDKK